MADHNDELLALLVDHTDAWNAHDLDSLMALFADDCVFEAAGRDEACGTTYAGSRVSKGRVRRDLRGAARRPVDQ